MFSFLSQLESYCSRLPNVEMFDECVDLVDIFAWCIEGASVIWCFVDLLHAFSGLENLSLD